MSNAALFERVLAKLEEERRAIVALDADAVESIASDKEGLFAALAQAPLTEVDGPLLASVAAAAKQNCLLLANARDLVRQTAATLAREVNGAAIESGAAKVPGQPAPPGGARRGVKLSVTG